MTPVYSIFWLSAAMVIYSYFGFALLVILVGIVMNRRVIKKPITPTISIIIAAYNEEKHISAKIHSILDTDYPLGNLEIIVASDGSDDDTEKIVSEFDQKVVKLISLPRQGKLYALDQAVRYARGELLVFSDANAIFDKNALRSIVQNFADPAVGGVCGNQLYVSQDQGDVSGEGESLYWSYDKWIKSLESRTGSIVSADGALYAIRSELYRLPQSTAVTDDFAISTSVIEQGYRLVYEPEAIAYEEPSPAAQNEFRRKVRIMNRGLRGVILRRKLLNPFRFGFYSFELFSHKALRRFVPFFLILLFGSSLLLSPVSEMHFVLTLAQALFYVLAIAGFLLKDAKLGELKLFYVPFYFCLVNTAVLIAIFKLIAGKRFEVWQPQRIYAQDQNRLKVNSHQLDR